MKRILCIISAIFFVFAGHSAGKVDKTEKEINDARNKKGELITCSPGGKVPGTLTIEEAVKKIKPGMELKILPGYYNPLDIIAFNQDRIIIEGDETGQPVRRLPLFLNGKDCIVRNITLEERIEIDDGVIVDTKAYSFTVTSGHRKGRVIISNCAANKLNFYANEHDITVRNTSIVTGVQVKDEGRVVATRTYANHMISVYSIINMGKMEKKGKVSFEKCMLFSEGHLFGGDEASMKLVNLSLDDNVIWCNRSLYRLPPGKSEIKTLEGLASYFAYGKDGKAILGKPQLKETPSDTWDWDRRPGVFMVTSGPGSAREYGCNMSESKTRPIPLE